MVLFLPSLTREISNTMSVVKNEHIHEDGLSHGHIVLGAALFVNKISQLARKLGQGQVSENVLIQSLESYSSMLGEGFKKQKSDYWVNPIEGFDVLIHHSLYANVLEVDVLESAASILHDVIERIIKRALIPSRILSFGGIRESYKDAMVSELMKARHLGHYPRKEVSVDKQVFIINWLIAKHLTDIA